ncbi:DUF4833 domain-containing protein [Parapedobacter koreensis]|uniref:DUF4833 domain-containing protein n=1 Tax=Parapedobacter koreensis TaxID=332977 RepID=A0A1H7U7C7_9SPHI|nr:DUF4833 domain-containing protein [Parapedobacter koreensis]SEL92950.1 protein of unknown function [Parapedobacter koreensis]
MLSSSFFQQPTLHDVGRYIRLKGSISIVLLFSALGLVAQENKFDKKVTVERLPVPKEKKQLFYLQRDPDENTIIYQLNMEDSVVNADDPVNVYWIRYTEGGVRKDLNFVQRTMAYGIDHKALGDGAFELRLAAYKNLPLRLSYCDKSKAYVVYATINSREAILDRIFVRIDGGSMFKPDIAYFELSGRDTATMAKVSERIKP